MDVFDLDGHNEKLNYPREITLGVFHMLNVLEILFSFPDNAAIV